MLHPVGFNFSALPALPSLNAFTEWPVAPFPAIYRPPLSLFLHSKRSLLSKASLLSTRVIVTHLLCNFISGLFVFQPPFPFFVKLKIFKLFWRFFAPTYPLMLSPSSPRENFSVCSLPLSWSTPFFSVKLTLSILCSRSAFLFLTKVKLSTALTISLLTIL